MSAGCPDAALPVPSHYAAAPGRPNRAGYSPPMQRAETTWGILDPAVLARVLVVSPHFDDAALGAAHLLSSHPGSTVVTVLAGRPPSYPAEPSEWDAEGGFKTGDDVVGARRKEDTAAMAVLGSSPVWLPDHVLTHDAGLLVREELAERARSAEALEWFCYEDHGYKHIPGLLAWRVATLFKSGLWPTPAIVPIDADMEIKRAAIDCYASQIAPLQREHALSERLAANVPEQYWRLDSPPRGWEPLMATI